MRSAVRGERRLDRAGGAAVLWLDDARAQAPGRSGAKGAALAVAWAAGLPVLPGFVVSTGFDFNDPGHLADLREAWCSLSHAGEVSLVVRSSSTVEDGSSTSMAGMFTSVLDVGGWDDFLVAVEKVLASGRDVARADGETGAAPMAVLVQPYLVTTAGGVMFGLDPVSGRDDRLVVAASDRGPAALVGGEVDGARYVLSRHGRVIEEPGGLALLDHAQLRHLARLARRAEEVFGGPQDVEWGIERGGVLRLLQSRPVTARGEVVERRGPVFGPGPVAETFPEPLAPLEQDLWAEPLREALRHALTLAGSSPARRLAASPVIVAVDGRLAVDLSVMPQPDGRRGFPAVLDPRPPLRKLMAAWRVGRLRAALPSLAADLIATADRDLLAVGEVGSLSDAELLAVVRRSRAALTSLHGHEVLMGWLVDAESATVTAASVALRLLAEGRAAGLSDEEIAYRQPGVLALAAPRIAASVALPPAPAPAAVPAAEGSGGGGLDPALLREALRLRARWVQELTARVAWELGRRLVVRGLLDSPGRVAWLRLEELEAAVGTGVLPTDVGDRHAAQSAPLPPRFRLTSSGAVVSVVEGGRKGGGGPQGAGGGRGSGFVHDGAGLPQPGAVLVVRTLDPNLAAVLPGLGGLVAETGSPLSHLAILAREMGVPTVVGVEGALTRFPPGALVLVDGVAGEVTRIDKERGAA